MIEHSVKFPERNHAEDADQRPESELESGESDKRARPSRARSVLAKRRMKTERRVAGLAVTGSAAVTGMLRHHPNNERNCPPRFPRESERNNVIPSEIEDSATADTSTEICSRLTDSSNLNRDAENDAGNRQGESGAGLWLEEVPVPEVGADDVLIRTEEGLHLRHRRSHL